MLLLRVLVVAMSFVWLNALRAAWAAVADVAYCFLLSWCAWCWAVHCRGSASRVWGQWLGADDFGCHMKCAFVFMLLLRVVVVAMSFAWLNALCAAWAAVADVACCSLLSWCAWCLAVHCRGSASRVWGHWLGADDFGCHMNCRLCAYLCIILAGCRSSLAEALELRGMFRARTISACIINLSGSEWRS